MYRFLIKPIFIDHALKYKRIFIAIFFVYFAFTEKPLYNISTTFFSPIVHGEKAKMKKKKRPEKS